MLMLVGMHMWAFTRVAACVPISGQVYEQVGDIEAKFQSEMDELAKCICQIECPGADNTKLRAVNDTEWDELAADAIPADSNESDNGNHAVFFISSSEDGESDSGIYDCPKIVPYNGPETRMQPKLSALLIILKSYRCELDAIFMRFGTCSFSPKRLINRLRTDTRAIRRQFTASAMGGLLNEISMSYEVLCYASTVCTILSRFIVRYKFIVGQGDYQSIAPAVINIYDLRNVVHEFKVTLQSAVREKEAEISYLRYLREVRE